MLVYGLIVVSFAVLFLCIGLFISYKELSSFRGENFYNSYIGRALSRIFSFKTNVKVKRFNMSNYLFVLNSDLCESDFFVIRGVFCIFGALISFAIVITMICSQYSHIYDVDSSLPIQFDSESYSTLSNDLVFDGSESDEKVLVSNVELLANSSLKSKLKSTPGKKLYSYIVEIHNRKTDLLNPLYLVLLIILLTLCWNLPFWFIRFIYRTLSYNRSIEYNDLEADIQTLADSNIEVIVEDLIKDSMFYRNMFRKFLECYTIDSNKAYAAIESTNYINDEFKRMIGQLHQIETLGPDYVKKTISAIRDESYQDMLDSIEQRGIKRQRRLNRLAVCAFMLAVIRLFTIFVGVFVQEL